MAKTKAPAVKPGKSVAVRKPTNEDRFGTAVAIADASALEAYSGAGMENVDTRDIIIPRLGILQALSPQLQSKKPEYIKGAKAGDFVNTALGKASKECRIIPCYYDKTWIEWRDRSDGGGIVAVYRSEDEAHDGIEQDEDGRWYRDGNLVSETRTFYCIDVTDPSDPQKVFLPMSSSSLRDARRWLTTLSAEKITGKNGNRFVAPMFYRSWEVTPLEKSNDQGQWFGYSFAASDTILEIDPTGQLLQMAVDFKDQIQAGAVKADQSAMSETEAELEEGV